jgi:hypothetical protein
MAPITGYRDGGERYLDPVTAKRRIGDLISYQNDGEYSTTNSLEAGRS